MNEDGDRLRPSPSVGRDAASQGRNKQPKGNGGTTEQLRSDVETGRTRDKVAYPDPAAAPLGTDAEAGGAPVPPRVAEAERERASERREQPRIGPVPPQAQRPWMIGLIVAAAVAAGIAALFAE